MIVENLDEMDWDPSDIVLKRGALVKCFDLVKSLHLSKTSLVEDYDEESGWHIVQFEDKDTKSCLVKPDNLRLLFFGK